MNTVALSNKFQELCTKEKAGIDIGQAGKKDTSLIVHTLKLRHVHHNLCLHFSIFPGVPFPSQKTKMDQPYR